MYFYKNRYDLNCDVLTILQENAYSYESIIWNMII